MDLCQPMSTMSLCIRDVTKFPRFPTVQGIPYKDSTRTRKTTVPLTTRAQKAAVGTQSLSRPVHFYISPISYPLVIAGRQGSCQRKARQIKPLALGVAMQAMLPCTQD